jgi:hypothetical protein
MEQILKIKFIANSPQTWVQTLTPCTKHIKDYYLPEKKCHIIIVLLCAFTLQVVYLVCARICLPLVRLESQSRTLVLNLERAGIGKLLEMYYELRVLYRNLDSEQVWPLHAT